jgi:UPF0755 protein
MKKYISSLLVLAICLSFTACAKSASGTAKSASENSTVSSGTSSVSEASNTLQSQSDYSSSIAQSSAVSKVQSQSQTASQTILQSSALSSQPATPTTVRVVIPEGFTLSQIGDRLEANGVCKKAALLSTANSYNFSYYSLIGKLNAANRCYKLEGYLFPNTYEFYTNMKPQDALGKMLKNSESKIASNYSYPGMTTDQIVTLASIIEKEANSAGEMQKISSVFHSRLKAGMRLQADPTVLYVEKYLKPNLTGNINRYNSYYNTNKCAALPVGAICNPGATALNAAANPVDTNYFYFAADKSGNYYYAQTYDEHKVNLANAGIIEGNSMQ